MNIMIRLIDVALIVLMGFIAISRLKVEHIDLPSGSDSTQRKRDIHELTLRIFQNKFEIDDRGRRQKLQTVETLEDTLVNFKNASMQKQEILAVNIETQRSVLMQTLIDVLDICQRHNIQQNLNYDSFR